MNVAAIVGIIVSVVVVVAVCIWLGYTRVRSESSAKKDRQPRPNEGPNQGCVLRFFYSNHCGHCTAMKPAWQEARKKMPRNLTVEEIEASAFPEATEKYSITGFPTLRMYCGGRPIEYRGDRTSKSIMQFVKDTFSPDGTTGHETRVM